MPLFKRRAAPTQQAVIAYIINTLGETPDGYTRLIDSPEVSACINRISSVVSAATIYLMQHSPDGGDRRINDQLSRLVDIDPWPDMGTRSSWMSWIVTQLLGDGDGNAFVLPEFGLESSLTPMPGAQAMELPGGRSYKIQWQGQDYAPSEVLHFRLFADPLRPWMGRGYRVQAEQVAATLAQTDSLKRSLCSPKYKPPFAVFVNSDAPMSDAAERERFREEYLSDTGDGKPWILPADFVKAEQFKPLSLTDLAVKDTIELDKRTVAGIFGVPPFVLGLGSFSEAEYNNFIRTIIIPICRGIEQELTIKLLEDPSCYFRFSRRHLYAYDLKTLIDIDLAMSDRGYLNGDEVREDAYRDPAGLTEFKVLENYLPYDMSGLQKKLLQPDETQKEDADNA